MTDNEITNEIRKHKLSPHMIEEMTYNPLGAVMQPGPTRAALMRRGLVHGRSTVEQEWRFGRFTEAGRELALKLRARP